MSNIKTTGVSLNINTLNINIGESAELTATVTPADATDKTVIWSSANSNIATVSNGIVKGVGIGLVDITVKTADGKYTDHCTVVVISPELQKVSVPTANISSGTIKSGTNVALSTETKDATIYYTTDGSVPTT